MYIYRYIIAHRVEKTDRYASLHCMLCIKILCARQVFLFDLITKNSCWCFGVTHEYPSLHYQLFCRKRTLLTSLAS